MSATTVYLNVGTPTAGAYLRRVLWSNRGRLADAGVCYPLDGPEDDFGAVMDLREMSWAGRRDPDWEGAWERMAGRVRAWDGPTAVLCQGQLAGATPQQARRAVAALEPAEVHVVFATHDLRWQLVLDWQEQLRHQHTVTFETFVDDLVARGLHAPKPFGELFWGLHDPVRALASWESAVPGERVHVLTLPPPAAGRTPLWNRFRALTGIPTGTCDTGGIDPGGPLPAVESELLRRLNTKLGAALGPAHGRLIGEHLTGPADGAPVALPARHDAWAEQRTRKLIADLRASGYRVVGDLDELVVTGPADGAVAPSEVPDERLAAASIDVVTGLLVRLNQLSDQVGLAHVHGQVAGIRDDLGRLLDAASAPSLQRAARRVTGRRSP